MAEKRLSNFQPTKCMLLEVYINQFSIESEPGQIIVAIVNESLGDRNGNNLHLHNFKICGAVHVRCQLHRQNKFDSFEKSAANLIFSHSFSVQSREVHDTTQNRKGIRGNKEHFSFTPLQQTLLFTRTIYSRSQPFDFHKFQLCVRLFLSMFDFIFMA